MNHILMTVLASPLAFAQEAAPAAPTAPEAPAAEAPAAPATGDVHATLARRTMATLNELTAVLGGVVDTESAEKALPQAKALAAELQAIEAEADKVPAPTPEQAQKLEQELGAEIGASIQGFADVIVRLLDTGFAGSDALKETLMPMIQALGAE